MTATRLWSCEVTVMWVNEWLDLPRLTTLTAIQSNFDRGEGYNTFQYPRYVTLESHAIDVA